VKPWHVKGSRTILDRRWLKVHEQHIELPWGGEIPEFHLIQAPDWVAVLAITATGELVLVEQYRHGFGAVSRELPSGVIEPGESVEQAARRELREETGYAGDSFEPLLTLNTEPSRHTNRAHFILARGVWRASEPSPDPSENIAVVLAAPEQALADIEAGRIVHGVHVAALLLAERRGLLGPR